MLHPGMIASPSASKESYSKGQVWVWKREEANWLCGLLWDPRRGFAYYKESFLFQPFRPPPHSLLGFILSHRSLAVGRVRKSSWEKDPSVQVSFAWPMTVAPAVDCETRSPLSLSLSYQEEKLLCVMTLWQMLAKALPCILNERHF